MGLGALSLSRRGNKRARNSLGPRRSGKIGRSPRTAHGRARLTGRIRAARCSQAWARPRSPYSSPCSPTHWAWPVRPASASRIRLREQLERSQPPPPLFLFGLSWPRVPCVELSALPPMCAHSRGAAALAIAQRKWQSRDATSHQAPSRADGGGQGRFSAQFVVFLCVRAPRRDILKATGTANGNPAKLRWHRRSGAQAGTRPAGTVGFSAGGIRIDASSPGWSLCEFRSYFLVS